MKKIAIFAEGQTELIFIRELLYRIMEVQKISFECLKFNAGKTISVKYDYLNPESEYHFLIINVQNDTRVLSAIKERERKMFDIGFSYIIGVRDMYCASYKKRSSEIDLSLNREICSESLKEISKMSNPACISLYYSIMEIESWILSLFTIFPKMDVGLTYEVINAELELDFIEIDTQNEFFKPSIILNKIFNLFGRDYKKKERDVEFICSLLEKDDIDQFRANNKCDSFKGFLNKLDEVVE